MAQPPPHRFDEPTAPDPRQCPLCGKSNQCAMERQRETGIAQGACWCTTTAFSLALLERVAPQDRNLACICAQCTAHVARADDTA